MAISEARYFLSLEPKVKYDLIQEEKQKVFRRKLRMLDPTSATNCKIIKNNIYNHVQLFNYGFLYIVKVILKAKDQSRNL